MCSALTSVSEKGGKENFRKEALWKPGVSAKVLAITTDSIPLRKWYSCPPRAALLLVVTASPEHCQKLAQGGFPIAFGAPLTVALKKRRGDKRQPWNCRGIAMASHSHCTRVSQGSYQRAPRRNSEHKREQAWFGSVSHPKMLSTMLILKEVPVIYVTPCNSAGCVCSGAGCHANTRSTRISR